MQQKRKGPGRADREGITLFEFMDQIPDEASARRWFEERVWPEGRRCPRCGSAETSEASRTSGLPYRCPACRKTFSVRTGTALAESKVPLRKWALAIYLMVTGLKGVSSMKLHRDLGLTQKTSWFLAHRIREAWIEGEAPPFDGPVEFDEVHLGGKRKWMRAEKRERLLEEYGRGSGSMSTVVGARDRESNDIRVRVVDGTDKVTLQGYVREQVTPGATVYTDEAGAYGGLETDYEHETVNHSVGEYVREQASVNGLESFWSMLRRGYAGTYHVMSPKHLQRYIDEFAGRHNQRDCDTEVQMRRVVQGLVGRRLPYNELIGKVDSEAKEAEVLPDAPFAAAAE